MRETKLTVMYRQPISVRSVHALMAEIGMLGLIKADNASTYVVWELPEGTPPAEVDAVQGAFEALAPVRCQVWSQA